MHPPAKCARVRDITGPARDPPVAHHGRESPVMPCPISTLTQDALPNRLACFALAVFFAAMPPVAAQQGQPVEHTWKRQYYGILDGQEGLMFAERFDRAKPALGDLDGDGDLDLLLGTGEGRIMVFENQGTAQVPRFRLVNESLAVLPPASRSSEDQPRPLVVEGNAAPALVDIDQDGDLDLFIGTSNGRLMWLINEGNRQLPLFRVFNPDLLGRAFGHNLVPRFADLNADGLPELTLGNEAGEYWVISNEGMRGSPRFCTQSVASSPCLGSPQVLGRLSPEDNAVPAWVDWDGDGDLDLVVGKSDGRMALLRNLGSARQGLWELSEPRFQILDAGGYAAPLFADLNGDRLPDLLLASDGELVTYFENRPQAKGTPLWLQDRNLLQVRHLGGYQSRMHVTSGDLDGDGNPELVLGTRTGRLLVYRNVTRGGIPAFVSPEAPLLENPQRTFSAPLLTDLDGDGDRDLLIGGAEGRLEYIENTGSPKKAAWAVRSVFYGRIDVGSLSIPATADLDGDGDLDLLVGNSLGNVVMFENTGTVREPVFSLRSVHFGGLPVLSHAAPAVFAWQPGAVPDLVVGGQSGMLLASMRDPARALTAPGGFRAAPTPWEGLRGSSYSVPNFVDMTADGKPDLLLGTGSGALLLWRLESSGAPAVAKALPAPGANILPLEDSPQTIPGDFQSAKDTQARLGVPTVSKDLPLDPVFSLEPSTLGQLNLKRASKPAFADLNGDGRPDLVVGTAGGALQAFAQTGPVENPQWRPLNLPFTETTHGGGPSPVFTDLNGDGDLDLVVGNATGEVRWWENAGTAKKPVFRLHETPLARNAGKNAVPAFADLDGDGLEDLLVGTLKGDVMFLRRVSRGEAVFRLELRTLAGLDVGVNASPAVGDLTGQGPPALLLGSDQGALHIYLPSGTSRLRSSGWRAQPSWLEGMKFPLGSHPTLVDLDGDGDLDLVVGSEAGPLSFYRNNARTTESPSGQAR